MPAPAPDLFVAEPDYGDVASGMVHVASAVLGRPMAWDMTDAVGVDPYGALVTVVIDGRQPGWSAGTTQAETQSLMLALGVRDATMLDGGGSTQLVVDGTVRNRPCCDARTRPVATVAAFVPSGD